MIDYSRLGDTKRRPHTTRSSPSVMNGGSSLLWSARAAWRSLARLEERSGILWRVLLDGSCVLHSSVWLSDVDTRFCRSGRDGERNLGGLVSVRTYRRKYTAFSTRHTLLSPSLPLGSLLSLLVGVVDDKDLAFAHGVLSSCWCVVGSARSAWLSRICHRHKRYTRVY